MLILPFLLSDSIPLTFGIMTISLTLYKKRVTETHRHIVIDVFR